MTVKPERDRETAARMAEVAMETNRRQLETADALDQKAWQALAAGSLIIGLGVAGDVSGWGLVAPLGAYIALAVTSLMCLQVRAYSVLPATWALWKDNWWRDRGDLDHAIVEALIAGEREIPESEEWRPPVTAEGDCNAELLHEKAKALRIAIRSLAIETVALVVAAAV